MNCPTCGAPMKSGRIETNAVFHSSLFMYHPANIIFEPNDPLAKKKKSTPSARSEGWYCEDCNQIVGVFEVNR